MEDVLDVYARPFDPKRPVVCVDETSKELHTTPAGTIAARCGRPTREDYEYQREGTRNLFVAVEPLRGWREVRVTERRTACDFAAYLKHLVDDVYGDCEQIVLVTDNLNTHTVGCLYERFAPEEAHRIRAKLEWHYTPEHGSWLNIAECELSVLARQCLNRRIGDADTLAQQVMAWMEARNGAQTVVQWHFTTADARIKLRRLYPEQK